MATQIKNTFPGYGAVPSITQSSATTGYIYNTGGTSATNYTWTSTGTGIGPVHLNGSPVIISGEENSGVIKLIGEKADVEINGVSLNATLAKIEQRLAILKPDIAMEAEWQELKELGDAYRKLEAEITEKMKTWDILKKE